MALFSNPVDQWAPLEDLKLYQSSLEETLEQALESEMPIHPIELAQMRAEIHRIKRLIYRRERIQITESGRMVWVEPTEETPPDEA